VAVGPLDSGLRMWRHRWRILISLSLVLLGAAGDACRAEPPGALRGVLARQERITPEFLEAWKARGATALVVPLDEPAQRRWDATAKAAERAGLALWPWIEVARDPALADAHPEWMASLGKHHDDWRRRFPSAPRPKAGEVVKVWPWVPIGYTPAFAAQAQRVRALLADLPGAWAGVLVNDLQAAPSSCGCGNDQCRWALDYGAPATAEKEPGDDAAARFVAALHERHPGKPVVPVWVTECQVADLPGAPGSTGLCGDVHCAQGDCWPRYVRQWNALLARTDGPIALALWPQTFQRDPVRWNSEARALFETPPRNGTPLRPERTVAVVQAWQMPEAAVEGVLARVNQTAAQWVVAVDVIDQSWQPRIVPVSEPPQKH
jgi:hypothetical protein